MYARKLSTLISLIALLTVFSSTANAKSIYAITDHGYRAGDGVPAKISAYGIDSDQIDLQKTSDFNQDDYPTGEGAGPVGVAIDSDSGFLFVTYERSNIIEMVNAKTMKYLDTVTALNATNLAGIGVNAAKKCLNESGLFNIMVHIA